MASFTPNMLTALAALACKISLNHTGCKERAPEHKKKTSKVKTTYERRVP